MDGQDKRPYTGRDGAGEPALLQLGFRPFFLAAGLWSMFAMALWLALLAGRLSLPSLLDPVAWHAHEMIFGYAAAAVAGFLLTAVPNWTGRLPVRGAPLAGLAGLWVLGRASVAASALIGAPLAALFDLAFPVLFFLLVGREILAGKSGKNLLMVALLALLVAGNAAMHLQALGGPATGPYGQRLGVAALVFLITVIGGRIAPSFTRNWLAKRGPGRMPGAFGAFDRVALLVTAAALLAWVAAPDTAPTAWLSLAAGLALALRLSRWCGWRTAAEPLLLVLHLGYAWLPVGFALVAASHVAALLPASAALHALTAGAIGTMTLAVMIRATLGHSGRPLTAGGGTVTIFALITLATVLRIAGAVAAGDAGGGLLLASGVVWIGGFGLFVGLYGPIMLRPTRDAGSMA